MIEEIVNITENEVIVAEKPANHELQTWVKKNMTTSLSKANLERLQQFVSSIPENFKVDNVTKLLMYFVEILENANTATDVIINGLQEEIIKKDTVLQETLLGLQTCKQGLEEYKQKVEILENQSVLRKQTNDKSFKNWFE